jgi:nitrogen fixation/metabolism regulation signal transduction histidine kinase
MLRLLRYGFGAILLIASALVVFWQGSIKFNFSPEDPEQTFVYFAISLLIFLLMVTLGFMLMRDVVKLWIDRRSGKPGSRIRTKLVMGALALSLMPVFFMVVFNSYVLNRTLKVWFTQPNEHLKNDIGEIESALDEQTRGKALAEAQLIASMPESSAQLENPSLPTAWLNAFCKAHKIEGATILPAGSMEAAARFAGARGSSEIPLVTAAAPILREGRTIGAVFVDESISIDFASQLKDVLRDIANWNALYRERSRVNRNFTLIMILIGVFVLFVAGWLAHFMARQISNPISALVRAAEEVSKGNLAHRVNEKAIDELAQLVSGFNRMTADLEANRAELEARRRFTEAILETIPTGIISVDAVGRVQRVNRALHAIFPDAPTGTASRLDDLFSIDDATEIRYLMNRARRTGLATQQLEVKRGGRTLHLAITVAAIDPVLRETQPGRGARNHSSGFVVIVEDTSDLLRAQKSAAWSEVARRVAHEIRNPLTPITLSAERIVRQANRASLPEAVRNLLTECASTILEETSSVKRLVDEFSQFSRLPAARLITYDLNDVVSMGMNVFESRLEGIEVHVDLAPDLPPVSIDPEQFKRVIVNLVDNAAEAMQDSPLKVLTVMTRAAGDESLELIVEDSGCGITSEEKEKLFLPYFSTKGRGTGLGLAIVSHILTEHGASVRVEDNKPCGARFTIEVPVAVADEHKTSADALALNL